MASRFVLVVEVLKVEVRERSGQYRDGPKAGKPWSLREQAVYADLGKAYPVAITVRLEDGAPPYQPGKYGVPLECIEVNRYGGLEFGRIKLEPVTARATAAA